MYGKVEETNEGRLITGRTKLRRRGIFQKVGRAEPRVYYPIIPHDVRRQVGPTLMERVLPAKLTSEAAEAALSTSRAPCSSFHAQGYQMNHVDQQKGDRRSLHSERPIQQIGLMLGERMSVA